MEKPYRGHPGQAVLDAALALTAALVCVFWSNMAFFHLYVIVTMILLGLSGLTADLAAATIRLLLVATFAVAHEVGHMGWSLEALSAAALLFVAGYVSALFGAYRRWTQRQIMEGQGGISK